jgi:hypothetical protein
MPNESARSIVRWLWPWAILLLVGAAQSAQGPRPIPIGIDAYKYWDRWAEQRIGMRVYA